MESKLEIVKTEKFGDLDCNFYKNEKGEVFVTRTQIGKALGYGNPSRAISDIHKAHKERLDTLSMVTKISLPAGGTQKVYVYNAKGIYEICRYSNQPKANDFYDWAYDVLEKVRTTGGYIYGEEIMNEEQLVITTLNVMNKKLEKLKLENQQKQQIISELQPKADYTDAILKSKSIVPITSIAKDYGMSGTAMNDKLHDLGVQYKMGTQWLLYAKYQDKGYTHSETINITHKDGTQGTTMNTKWTQKGRLFLYNLLKDNGLLPMIEREAA